MEDMFNNGNNNDNNGYINDNGRGYFPDGEFRGDYGENYDLSPEPKGSGLAIAAFVIALVNIIPCCTILSIISVPLCLILAIVSLAGKRKGKGFAITAIILSLLAGLMFAYYGFIMYKVAPDYVYFIANANQIVEDYEEDGTIPERYEKYRDPKYDKYWKRSGYDSFDEFFEKFIEGYSAGLNSASGSYSNTSSSEEDNDKDQIAREYIPIF